MLLVKVNSLFQEMDKNMDEKIDIHDFMDFISK